MEFREQLMELRKQRGWSQEQLGAKIGVTRQTVSKWETGDTTPELAKLIELSSLFEISVDRLIGIEERKDTAPVYIHETGWNYEYKSKTTLWGLPLVHINVGRGLRRAKGVIAVGELCGRNYKHRRFISRNHFNWRIIGRNCLDWRTFNCIAALRGRDVNRNHSAGRPGGWIFCSRRSGTWRLLTRRMRRRIQGSGRRSGQRCDCHRRSGQGTVEFPLKNGVSSVEIRQAILDKFPGTWKWLVRLYGTLGR